MGLWSELPGDLLRRIDDHLGRYFDKIRFTCVCTYWQSELPKLSKLPHLPLRQPQPPWLLLPYKTGSMCGLYDPLDNMGTDIDLPEAGEKVFKGAGHGWVVTEQLNGSIDVVNPLTRDRVPLPPRYKFPDVIKYDPENIGKEYLILPWPRYAVSSSEVRDDYGRRLEKVVLSSSPLSDDFIAVALFASSDLAYCKVGDSEWHRLVEFDKEFKYCNHPFRVNCYKDITFFRGKLYAVTRGGRLKVCDDIRSCPRMRECDELQVSPFRTRLGDYNDKLTLTSSPDSLVTIVRKWKITGRSTAGFEMYRLDVDPNTTTGGWTRIKSLDDDEILFMGLGSHILFSSHDFTGNRVYFDSDRLKPNHGGTQGCFHNGVFDFKDGSFKPLDYDYGCSSPCVIWPSPIWFTPNPH